MLKKLMIFSLLTLLCFNTAAIAEVQAAEVEEYIYYEDFENAEIDTKASEYIFNDVTSSNAHAEVQVGPNGSKAIKITDAGKADVDVHLGLDTFEFPVSGQVEIKVDVMFESFTKDLGRFFDMKYAGGGYAPQTFSYGTDIYTIDGGWNGYAALSTGSYMTLTTIIDFDKMTITDYVGPTERWTTELTSKSITALSTNITADTYGNHGVTNYNPEIPFVMWIDNISIRAPRIELKNTVPADKSTDVNPAEDVKLTFSDNVSEVDESKFRMYENGEIIESFSWTTEENVITISSDILTYGAEYKLEIDEEGIKTDSGKGGILPVEYSFTTKSIIHPINIKDGGYYPEGFMPGFRQESGITYETELKFGENVIEDYVLGGSNIAEQGKYTLTVTATDEASGKVQVMVLNFEIVGPVAPIAENPVVAGIPATGETVTAKYDFVDYNSDKQGESIIKWMRSDTAEETPVEIKDETGETVTGKNYVLTEDDENCYIWYEVTPVSKKYPYEGEPAMSAPFTGAFAPEAKNVEIKEKDGTLTGKYTYYDKNEETDELDFASFAWYYCDENGENLVLIDDATTETFTIGEEDINAYLVMGVTVNSTNPPCESVEAYSKPYILPTVPTASDVKITGTAKAGQTLMAEYIFEDVNGDKEEDSSIKWYVDGVAAGDDKYLTVTSDMAGETIYFEVIPRSEKYPYEGEAVKSNSVTATKTATSTGGGNNSVSGSGKKKGSSSVVAPVVTPTPTPDVPVSPEVTSKFNDTASHWANKEIEVLAEKGIVNGNAEGGFAPDNTVTRAEVAAMIARAFGYTGEYDGFTDVTADKWYAQSVAALAANEIVTGAGGMFRPEDKITREELCVILCNAAEKQGLVMETAGDVFGDDTEISDWAKDKVYAASGAALVNGIGEGKFAPKKNATRAEFAVIVYRLLEKLN